MNRKRLISFFMTVVLAVVALFAFSLSGYAANGITQRLDSLRTKYPQGYYWNHKMSTNSDESHRIAGNRNEKFSQSVTSKPCTTHKVTGKAGYYDCNYFDGGIQCFGFARRVFYDVFGVKASACKKRYDYNNIKVGDCLRLFNDTHSAVVLERNGNTLTVVECNLELSGAMYNCMINWGATCKVSDVTYFHRATNYDKIKSSTTNKKPGKTSSIKAVTTTNSVKLTWNKVSGATGYRVYQYDYNKGSSDRLATITGTTYTIKNLKPHTRYRFSVKAYKKVGSTYYWSDTYTIIKTATKPGQVTGLKVTPSTTTAKLSWTKVSGATGYHIFLYNTSTKKYTDIGKCTTNSITVKNLTKGKTYNFAVQAYSTIEGKNYWGKVSAVVRTTTLKTAAVQKPGKTSAIKAVTTTNSVKLTWNKVSGATGYRVYQYDYNKGSSDRLATITGTTYTIKNLKAHTRYRFSVKAYKKVGSTYYWSDSYTIINTATKPGQVTGLKATPSTTTVKLTWNKVSGATGYHIFLYNTSTKKYTDIGKCTTNSITVKNLTKGKTYNFAVQAYSTIEGKNYWGKVSSALKVTTKKSTSTSTTVSNPGKVNITTVIPDNTMVTIYWNKVSDATGYEIYNYNTSTATYTSMGTVTSAGCTISQLTYNTTYYYAVRAYKTVNGVKYKGEMSSKVKVVTNLTSSAWYKGYQSVLNEAFSQAGYDGYFLGDITGDCSPELFINKGRDGGFVHFYAEIYTLKNGVATYVGSVANGHYLLAPTENGIGFLRMVARQGDDTVFYQTTDRLDDSFTLYAGTSVFDGTPDFKDELVYFTTYYGYDYEGLKWTANPYNNNLSTLKNSSYGTYYG